MKKDVLNFKLIVLVLVILGVTIFISCEKEKLVTTSPDLIASEKIDVQKICSMHNNIISKVIPELEEVKTGFNKNDYTAFLEEALPLITNTANQLDPNFDYEEIDFNRFTSTIEKFSSNNEKSVDSDNIDFSDMMSLFLEEANQEGLISEYFKLETIKLAIKAESIGRDEIIEYSVNEYATDISTDELIYKELIQNMLVASNEIWLEKAEGSSVILADGIGALYGLLLSPVGSIVYGTGFSLLENEIKDYR